MSQPKEVFSIKKPRRRRWKAWAAGVFLFFSLSAVGLGYLIFQSPVFQINEFEFRGFRSFDAEETKNLLIRHAIGNSRAARLLTPDNILFWSPFFLEGFDRPPALTALDYSRDFYERKVVIEVSERRAFGIWCPSSAVDGQQPTTDRNNNELLSDGHKSLVISQCHWFDEEGVLFAEAPAAEGYLIPKIIDVNGRPAGLKKEILAFAKALSDLEQFKAGKILVKDDNLQEIEVETFEGPDLYFSLRYPLADIDFDGFIGALKDEIELKKIRYIDFRVPNRIYYK